MISIICSIIEAMGAVATVISVIWAIRVYKMSNEDKEVLEIKKDIMTLPEKCKRLDNLLSEPLFSAIGNSIAEELEALNTDNQSLEEFSNDFLLNEESRNYKALAIYMGLKRCDEVKEITKIAEEIEECQRNIISKFPVLGKAFLNLSFYITLPAEKAVTSGILNANIQYIVDGEENEGLKRAVNSALEAGRKELYFKRIALHLTGAISANLSDNKYGQRSITLAQKMLLIISNVFEMLDESDLKSLSKKDRERVNEVQRIEEEMTYSVEISMELLKMYKMLFDEKKWDKLVEYKGRIIEVMEKPKEM